MDPRHRMSEIPIVLQTADEYAAAPLASYVGSSALMNRFISFVARGCAWKEMTYPPTMRYLTLWALNTDKRSLKSWNIRNRAFHRVSSKSNLGDRIHTLIHGTALPVPVFVSLHFLSTGIGADGLVHASVLEQGPPWVQPNAPPVSILRQRITI